MAVSIKIVPCFFFARVRRDPPTAGKGLRRGTETLSCSSGLPDRQTRQGFWNQYRFIAVVSVFTLYASSAFCASMKAVKASVRNVDLILNL